ncbi:glycosyltransferase [Sciscionella sediminilitoris]|uniref:glycosyltransferase n=1 Tax=Sciscionella sediminilitoris TaxID=1445613 RepID=UPI0005623B76|nr:glycosyltransferase [Sciscionella sp. SE31]
MTAVLICAGPFRGHVMPLLPLAGRLVELGHRVRFLTGSRYRDAVTGTGAQWEPLPARIDFDEDDTDGTFPQRRELGELAQGKFDLEHVFLRPIPAQAARIEELLDAEPVDTVVVETMFFGAIPVALRSSASRRDRPRIVAWGSNPLNLPDTDLAPAGLGLPPANGALGRLRNRAVGFAMHAGIFRSLQGIARDSVHTAGAELPLFFLDWLTLTDDIVQLTVPGFEYPRAQSRPRVHYAGPLSVSDTGAHPLPDWWAELDSRLPTVLVTQGSAEPDLDQLVRPTLTALETKAVNVLVSLGGRETGNGLALPANARLAGALPYDEVFPALSAFVTNGGYGGVGFAIRHGVPVVAVGRSQDKAEVAARVRWSGIGIGVRRRGISARAIGQAVGEVLRQPRYRARAREFREQAAQCSGLDAAVRVVAGSGTD